MKRVGAQEARVHFSALLAQVAEGESFLVTRHGRAVALLTQPTESVAASGHASREEVIRELAEFGRGIRLGDISLQALRDEGRR